MSLLLLLLLLACTCEPAADEPEEGKWFEGRDEHAQVAHGDDPDLTPAQREQIEMLEAIGYADGTVEFSGATSVTVHDRDRAWQGYNFYNSGHAPEAVLVDMDGRELHRWRHDFWDAFPGYPVRRERGGTHNWRRAWLRENGDVLAIHEGLGLVRLDADSRLRWANPNRIHHDLDFAPDGTIWTLARKAHVVPRVDPEAPILEDYVVALDPDTGREQLRISLLEALERSDYAHLLDRRGDKADIFHTNTVSLLDGTAAHPAFAAGNVLLSMRTLSAILVLDPRQRKIVWAHTGAYRAQHDPKVVAPDRLMLFDNAGRGLGRSRVLVYELPGMEVAWEWGGSLLDPLASATLGAASPLPNGNVLVTDSEQGRALEVEPGSGDVVWAFYNPHVAGPNGEYVAALFELTRLPPDFPIDWAEGAPAMEPE